MSSKKNSPSLIVFSKYSFNLGSVLWIVLAGLVFTGFLTAIRFNILTIQRQEAVLLISFENGERRMFQGEVIEGMTVLQALAASSKAGQIKLEYSLNPENKVIIEELNGYTKNQDKELVFYLNDSKIDSENINGIAINGGDRIEVRPE